MKYKTNYKNIDDGRETVIPWEVMGFINLLYTLGIIPKVSINADFMNKYRPDLLWNEYKAGYGKSYNELKEHFEDLEKEK